MRQRYQKMPLYTCLRCATVWVPKRTTRGKPGSCPRCRSPRWDVPRNPKDYKAARKQVAQLRRKGATQREAAEAAGVSATTVSRWEKAS